MNYSLKRNSEHLDKLLVSDMKILFDQGSNIIKCRLCLFLKEMLPVLFVKREYYFQQIIFFLFNCLIDLDKGYSWPIQMVEPPGAIR